MRRAFTLLEMMVFLTVTLMAAAILWPIFYRPRPDHRTQTCQTNLKQIGLGFLQYAQDYDEKLPPARATSTKGWADLLLPYIKSKQLLSCPATQSSSVASTDYFFNRQMARVASDRLDEPSRMILFGDGEENAPLWSSWPALPFDATTNPSSPARRHRDGTGANYGFSDGHVKWIRPSQLEDNATWKPRLFSL